MPATRPNVLVRFGEAVKAFGLTFSGYGGAGWGTPRGAGFWGSTPPGSRYDPTAEIRDPTQNSIVAAAVGWVADNLPEPRLRVVERLRPGKEEEVEGHPLPALVDNPNPFYDGDTLWAASVWDYIGGGNAYWYKAKSSGGNGAVRELWYLPAWQVLPRWATDGSEYIDHYEYRVDGRPHALRLDQVIHFQFALDRITQRGGMGRMDASLREIAADNEAATYRHSILRNMGQPGVIIGPKDPNFPIPPEAREAIAAQYNSKFSGDNRGKALVSSDGLTIDAPAFSPEQLALDKMERGAILRILATLRIPPQVLYLSDGPSAFDNGGQQKAAREAAYEDCLMPLGRRFARTLSRQLLPDLGDPRREVVDWDYSKVRALSEDEDALFKRWTMAFGGGWAKRKEARAAGGLESNDDVDDVYLKPAAGSIIPGDEPAPEPGPFPALPNQPGADGAVPANGNRPPVAANGKPPR